MAEAGDYLTVAEVAALLRLKQRRVYALARAGTLPSRRVTGRLLFARDGLIRGNLGRWRDYLRPDFHPEQHDASMSRQWLQDNAHQSAVVGQRS